MIRRKVAKEESRRHQTPLHLTRTTSPPVTGFAGKTAPHHPFVMPSVKGKKEETRKTTNSVTIHLGWDASNKWRRGEAGRRLLAESVFSLPAGRQGFAYFLFYKKENMPGV